MQAYKKRFKVSKPLKVNEIESIISSYKLLCLKEESLSNRYYELTQDFLTKSQQCEIMRE